MANPDDNTLENRGCADGIRLKQVYKGAVFAWNLYHSYSINGVHSIDASSRLRRELLDARLKAIDDLYDHNVNCPVCKLSRRDLIA